MSYYSVHPLLHYNACFSFRVQLLLQENRRIRSKIPPALGTLMVIHVERIDRVLEPGLTSLSWTSVTLQSYVEEVYEAFAAFELLLDRASDLIEFRINAVLQDIGSTVLSELPTNEPWIIEDFVSRTTVSKYFVVL